MTTATVSTNTQQLSYFFAYGFTGGPAHSRTLRTLLQQAGYVAASRIDQADIVVAHSAGCWSVTADLPAKLIMFVGMPLQDGHRLATHRRSSTVTRIVDGKRLAIKRSQLNFLSLYYTIKQPRRNMAIFRKAGRFTPPPELKQDQVVFVVNEHDPWPKSLALEQQLYTTPFSLISLPGVHNDIYYNPERYVTILNYYAQRILATTEN